MRARALALFLAAACLAGCSSDLTCTDVCACEGLAGDKLCLATCQANRDADAKNAAAHDCSAQASEASTCTADHASCDSVKKQYVYPIDACKTQNAALDQCLGATSTTSTGAN